MFKFKKVASIFASAVMLSSTIASAATMYPAPYNVASKTAIIWGTDANAADMTAANMVAKDLNEQLVVDSVTTDDTEETDTDSEVTGGDFLLIEKSNNKFGLGEDVADFYTTIDSDELSEALKDGVYSNDLSEEFEYTQEIKPSTSLTLTHFEDSEFNDDNAMIGFDLASGTHILNYTLSFDDAAEGTTTDFDDLETTEIEMLGKIFYVSQADNTANGVKLTLLDTANEGIVSQGETTTMTMGEGADAVDYEVSLTFIDADEVIFDVNGVKTNKLAEGSTYKIAPNTYIGVKSILYDAKESGISQAEFTIGSGKIVMEHGQEVQVNGEDLSDSEDSFGYEHEVTAYITNTTTNLDEIVLRWDLADDAWIVPASDDVKGELIMPGFNTIKLSMKDFVFPTEESTVIENDGSDSWNLKTMLKDGDVDFNLMYSNSSTTGIVGLGDSATKLLLTNTGSNPELYFSNFENYEYFVVTAISGSGTGDDAESCLLQITKVDDSTASKNTTTIKNLADNSEKTIDIGDSKDFCNVNILLNLARETTGLVNLTISGSGGTTAYADRLVTKDGLRIRLPVDSVSVATDGFINLTAVPTSFAMNVTEEDEDGGISLGGSTRVTLGYTSDPKTTVSSYVETGLSGGQDFEVGDDSDKFVGFFNTSLATQVIYDISGDQDKIEFVYHGEESYAQVYLSEVSVDTGSSSGGSGKIPLPILDSESSSVESKNWIVVGGSCVNQVAATLIGADYKTCGADWTAKTTVGAGQFLIETYDRGSGKVATLIAGYDVEDTDNAAKFLTTQENVDTSVGKKYVGTTATQATLV